MKTIKAAVIGYGNIGKAVLEGLKRAPDFEITGLLRRKGQPAVEGVRTVFNLEELLPADVALLCHPSRAVPALAQEYAARGLHTIDSFDIHSEIWDYVEKQEPVNQNSQTVSVVAAGWDPGSDSAFRALLEAMAPQGTTHTNFGPGMSMGHSVAVRAIPGVKDGISITMPEGKGIHSRKVYVELQEGFAFEQVAAAIKADPYFVHDITHVEQVESVRALANTSHGVLLERQGASGAVEGQTFTFDMRIDNPALTGQIMVSCARAATKLAPGCYTMPEIPPMLYLPGERKDLIKRLV